MQTLRDLLLLVTGFLLLATILVQASSGPEHSNPEPSRTEYLAAEPGGFHTTPDQMRAYADAAAYSERLGGLSLLAVKQGTIVLEEYAEGHGADTAHRLASGTKSFWGVAAICMVEDGLLSLDERAADTLSEWKEDPRKRKITVRQLLNLSSGLAPAMLALQNPRTPDKYAYAVNRVPCNADPGTEFQYGPSQYYALGELMQRKLKGTRDATPLDYLKRRVLDPIGLEVAEWRHDKAGNPNMPSGASLTAREWAKFGRLVLDEGRWTGKPIVPAERLTECFKPSEANPAYGLTFWLNRPVAAENPGTQRQARFLERAASTETDDAGNRYFARDMPRDIVIAAGAGRQRLYVIPSLEMIVVRQGESGREFSDAELLGRLLAAEPPAQVTASREGEASSTRRRYFQAAARWALEAR